MNWASGHNMPGYLPESDPWITSDWNSARLSLIEDLERLADSEAELLDLPEREVGQIEETISDTDTAIAELKALEPNSEYSTVVGDYAYWLSATDAEPEEDES